MTPDENFWYWLIAGILDVVMWVLSLFPVHRDWGMAEVLAGNLSMSILMVLSLVGAFIHLGTFFVTTGTIVILEAPRALFALYKWIKDLNPVAP